LIQQGFQVSSKPVIQTRGGNEDLGDVYIMSGTYWEEDNCVKIIAILRESTTDKAVASVEGLLSNEWIERNNVKIKPDNSEQVIADDEILNDDYVISEGGLVVDLWTNKGADNVVFSHRDTMKLYVRSNQPCYLRFIYHASDGTRLLLLDNYYLPSENVNQIVKILQEFECIPPFGAEILQILAQSVKFEPIETEYKEGNQYLKGDFQNTLSAMRKVKPINNNGKAEKLLTLTTVP